MAGHEEKHCPRCNQLFECKAGNISQCQCNNVNIDPSAAEWIKEQYQDCLCLQCLYELSDPTLLVIEKYKKKPN